MLNTKRAWSLSVAGVLIALFLGITHSYRAAYAASADIIINEIMYNPASDVDGDEFLELYNTTASDVDLTGWCFTAGIALCFAPGTTLPAHDYGIVSPGATRTMTTYGKTTIGTYTGKLDNGGERVTLSNSTPQIVNTVVYDDVAPWPTSPDGSGPSLELKKSELDNAIAASWGASLSPTPGEENSLANLDPPVISNVSKPANVQSADIVRVTAAVSSADSVELTYKVMFNSDQTLNMNDTGSLGDVTAGDGIYSAQIPAQTAGKLVRFKITASNSEGSISSPSIDESINYYGYVVRYQAQAGASPRLEWFISDSDYEALQDSGTSDTYFPSVVSYGDQVLDNAQIRLKGNYSRTFIKKPYKVKLPKGYTLTMPEVSEYPLNEFHLNSDYPNGNFYISSILSWQAFQAGGMPVPQFRKIQLQRNGQFEGAYLLADKYSKEWLEKYPSFKTGEMYDAWWENQNSDNNDTAARDAWKTNSLSLTGQPLKKYIRDTYDLPNIINYLAISAIVRHHDWSTTQNLITYRDKARTQRWSIYPWDLDLTFNASYGTMVDPTQTPDYLDAEDRFFATAIWNDPELKQMYLRRTQELANKLFASGQVAQWASEDWQDVKPTAELDFDKWQDISAEQADIDMIKQYIISLGIDPDSPEVIEGYYQNMLGDSWKDAPDPLTTLAPLSLENRIYFKFTVGIREQTQSLTVNLVEAGELPSPQPANSKVIINELMYDPPGGNNHEFIELYNPNSYAVDVSGWQINGVSMTLPSGSVVPGSGYATVVKNDTQWRQEYGGGSIVLGEYSGNLSNSGETITLLRTDTTVADSVAYSSASPWPDATSSTAKSLERISEYCWASSSVINGSPGADNGASGSSSGSVCTEPAASTVDITMLMGSSLNNESINQLVNEQIGLSNATPRTPETGSLLPKNRQPSKAAPAKKGYNVYQPWVVVIVVSLGLLVVLRKRLHKLSQGYKI